MASYSGRARSQGFDPVKLPDTARRMLEASDRKRYAQRKVYEADIQQRKEYGAAMEAKAKREVAQVESNFELQDEFTKAYTNQLKENFKQLKENEKTRTAQELQKMCALGQFAPSIMGLVKDIKEKDEEDQTTFGQNLIAKYGITKEEYNQLRLSESELQAEGAANNRIVEQLKSKGASPDEIKAIRDLDGWRLYGAQKQWAMSAKGDWMSFLNNPENRRKKYDNGEGQMMSLEEAKTSNSGMYYTVIRDQLQSEFLKPYQNLNPAFASQYLYKGITEVNVLDTSNFQTKQNEQFEQEEKDAFLSQLSVAVSEGPQSLSAFQANLGSDNATNRTRTLDYIFELVEKGDPVGIQAYEMWMSSPSPQDPNKSNDELWMNGNNVPVKAQLTKIQKKIDEINSDNYRRSEQKKEIAYTQKVQEIYELEQQLGGLNYEEWSQLDDELSKPEYGYKGLPDSMKSNLNGNRPDNLALIESVKLRIAQGIYVDPSDLEDGKYSNLTAAQRNELNNLVKPLSAGGTQLDSKAVTSIKTGLRGDLKNLLGTVDTAETSTATQAMVDIGFDWFMDKYQTNIANGMSGSDALTDARTALVDEFKAANNDKNYSGIFRLRTDANGNKILGFRGGFAELDDPQFTAGNTTADRQATSVVFDLIDTDPQYLTKAPAFGDISDSTSWAAYITSPEFERSRRPTNWLIALDRKDTNNTWQEIVNAQRQLYGKDPIDFERAFVPKAAVRPEVQGLLTKQPNNATKARAYTITYGQQDPANRFKPVLDLLASKESSNDQRYGGYDAMNLGGNGNYVVGTTTGTDYFGKKLQDYTVNEILQMQASGKMHAVGRYQFIHSTLKEQVREQAIDPNSKFDQAVQDKLAIGYFNESVGTFRSMGKDVIVGLGQRWHGLQKIPRSKIQEVLNQMEKDPKISSNFYGLDYKPNVLVHFYTGGNIGPTSTGQHTDVKQMDNPKTSEDETLKRFAPTELDEFVMVDDRVKGMVPLSQTTVTSGYDSLRDGGTRVHRGLDYGTYKGDKLFLKNGAKKISKVATAHGDKVTIELPNGQRFSFLHGRGAK